MTVPDPLLHFPERKRALKVKCILPALTEATDPYWRPIKYSLFPPLGLATLAAYLSPDDEAVIVDEHVEPLTLEDAPDLVAAGWKKCEHLWHAIIRARQLNRVTPLLEAVLSRPDRTTK